MSPSIGFHVWHLARWADRVQASIAGLTPRLAERLGPGRETWEAEDLADRWGFATDALGHGRTGSGMDDADAEALPLPGKDVLLDLARERGLPLAGQDAKTGQTLYKTVLAPMLRIRGLKLIGWYSTNILGNADGFVLDDPLHGATKVQSKGSVLESILGYSDFTHRVRIDYYPPRGDRKEAWDSVDFEGWLGERMSMRIDWQGSDSVLAAPLVVDLVRFVELAHRRGESGPIVPLAMFFKSPYGTVVHDFFEQYELFREWVASIG